MACSFIHKLYQADIYWLCYVASNCVRETLFLDVRGNTSRNPVRSHSRIEKYRIITLIWKLYAATCTFEVYPPFVAQFVLYYGFIVL